MWQGFSCFSGKSGAKDKILAVSSPSSLFLFLPVSTLFSITRDNGSHMTLTDHNFISHTLLHWKTLILKVLRKVSGWLAWGIHLSIPEPIYCNRKENIILAYDLDLLLAI